MCTFALALACGDATGTVTGTSDASTDGPLSTSEAASGDATATAGESSTSDAPTGGVSSGTTTTSGPGTTTGEAPVTTGGETSTGDATTTTTTGDTTTTGTTGAPVQPVTRAWWVDSLSLQIRVIQQDVEAGLCRGFFLEALANGGHDAPKYEPVEQPAEWGVRHVWVHQDLGDCFDPYQFFEKPIAYAAGATGTVTFDDVDSFGRPASADLEITATYEPAEPWVPAEDLLVAVAVAVETG